MTSRLSRTLLGAVTSVCSVVLLAGPGVTFASAAQPPAKPVPDCNTPNQSGGTGILETPADTNAQSQQYLTKTGTGYNAGGTSYNFTLTSIRTSGATFTQLTDCAYSTINGNAATATYNENISPINFTYSAQTQSWTANFSESVSLQSTGAPDNICDRVQLQGTDNSTPFTDYSNLVASTPSSNQSLPGAATTCAPTSNVPEVPATGLIAVAGLGAAGAALVAWRRRDPLIVSEG